MGFRSTALLAGLIVSGLAHANTSSNIHVNQLGFLPSQHKAAVVPTGTDGLFSLVDKNSGKTVYQAELSKAEKWAEAGETVHLADFSELRYPGEYQLVSGSYSANISIKAGTYDDALAGAIKYYYFNRSGASLEERHAGPWARPAGPPDTIVYVDESAATAERPFGTVISSPKGWYDAGDYGKYIVNSVITTHTLLRTLENHPDYFAKLSLNIPESNNQLPDLLDEIFWNLDWMATMQDSDGGFYHKLTPQNFEDLNMPHLEYKPRFVVQKSVAATLGAAGTFARASRVVANYKDQLPGLSAAYQRIAQSAWQWALKHPDLAYQQPSDFKTGIYANRKDNFEDEWSFASAELFALTGDKQYLKAFKIPKKPRAPEWADLETIALITLANTENAPKKLRSKVTDKLIELADSFVADGKASGYAVAMRGKDFRWGSNGLAGNKALTLLDINKIAPNSEYVKTAEGLLDYIVGRNPMGISYITGFGERSTKAPHHRASEADTVEAPVPGMLAGGPHVGYQDKAECINYEQPYDNTYPAKSYKDHWCSYATNEVAINWNAGLVYVLAEIRALYQ